MTQSLQIYQEQLETIKQVIEAETWDVLEMMLGQTKGARSNFQFADPSGQSRFLLPKDSAN